MFKLPCYNEVHLPITVSKIGTGYASLYHISYAIASWCPRPVVCPIVTLIQPLLQGEEEAPEEIPYASPAVPRDAFFAEHFDDPAAFERRWVRSQAKKDGADEEIAKYDGTGRRTLCADLLSVLVLCHLTFPSTSNL